MKQHPQASLIAAYALLYILTVSLLISTLALLLFGPHSALGNAIAGVTFPAFLASGAILIVVAVIIRCPRCGRRSCINFPTASEPKVPFLPFAGFWSIDRLSVCIALNDFPCVVDKRNLTSQSILTPASAVPVSHARDDWRTLEVFMKGTGIIDSLVGALSYARRSVDRTGYRHPGRILGVDISARISGPCINWRMLNRLRNPRRVGMGREI